MRDLLCEIVDEREASIRIASIIGLYDRPIIRRCRTGVGHAFVVPGLDALSNRITRVVEGFRRGFRRRDDEIKLVNSWGWRERRDEAGIYPADQLFGDVVLKIIVRVAIGYRRRRIIVVNDEWLGYPPSPDAVLSKSIHEWAGHKVRHHLLDQCGCFGIGDVVMTPKDGHNHRI